MDEEPPVQMEIDAVDDDGEASTIGEILASSKEALLEAAETITKLRLENEAITLRYASALVDVRRSNTDLTNLKSALSPLNKSSAGPLFSLQKRATEAENKAADNARVISELKHSIEKQQRLRADSEENLVRAKRKAVEDADQISKLQADVNELIELRSGTQRQLDVQKLSNMKLVRDAEMQNAAHGASNERKEFLEGERRRLSAEILELSSKLNILHEERVREAEITKKKAEKLRAEMAAEKKEKAALDQRCKLLQEEICSQQKHREKEREDSAAEKKELMEIISIHKDELKDANSECKRFEKLLETLVEEKLATQNAAKLANGNSNSNRALDSHAEALLKELESTLNEKLKQLHRQKAEMEERDAQERRLQIAFENQARETEMAKRRAHILEDEKCVAEQENRKLHQQIRVLNDKLLAAGSLSVFDTARRSLNITTNDTASPATDNNNMGTPQRRVSSGDRYVKRRSLTR